MPGKKMSQRAHKYPQQSSLDKLTLDNRSNQQSCRPAAPDVIKRISEDVIRKLEDSSHQNCIPTVCPRTSTKSVTPTFQILPRDDNISSETQGATVQSDHSSQKDLLQIVGGTPESPPPESIQTQPIKRGMKRILSPDSEPTQNSDQRRNWNKREKNDCQGAQVVRNRRHSYFNNDSKVMPKATENSDQRQNWNGSEKGCQGAQGVRNRRHSYFNNDSEGLPKSSPMGKTIQSPGAKPENSQNQLNASSYTIVRINNQDVRVKKPQPVTYIPQQISPKSSQMNNITPQHILRKGHQNNATEQPRYVFEPVVEQSNDTQRLQYARQTHLKKQVGVCQNIDMLESRTIMLQRNMSSQQTMQNSERQNHTQKIITEIMLKKEIFAEQRNSCCVSRTIESHPKTIPQEKQPNLLDLSPSKKIKTPTSAPVTQPSFSLGNSVSAPSSNMEQLQTGTQRLQNVKNLNSVTTLQGSMDRINSSSLDPSSSFPQHVPSKHREIEPETLKNVSTTPIPVSFGRFSHNKSPLLTEIDGVIIEELETRRPSRRRRFSIEDDVIQTSDNLQGEDRLEGLLCQPVHSSVENEEQSAELQHKTQLSVTNPRTSRTMNLPKSQGLTQAKSQEKSQATPLVMTETTPQATSKPLRITRRAPRAMKRGVPQVTTEEMNPSIIQGTPLAMTRAATARMPQGKTSRKPQKTTFRNPRAETSSTSRAKIPKTLRAKTQEAPQYMTQDTPHSSNQIMAQFSPQSNRCVSRATGASARQRSVANSRTQVMRPNVLTVTDSSVQTTQDSLMEMAKYNSPVLLSQWSCARVQEFVLKETGFQDLANKFFDQDVDGAALSILNCDHLIRYFGARLGTAIRLIDRVQSLSSITWKSLTNEDS